MRPREGVLWKFWCFSGLFTSRWDQKLILPPEQYAHCCAAIKDFFWFLVCYAATQLANQLHQTRIQVVRSLTKISKSCSEVIQRTLQFDTNWLRYSSFSVMSRVKWTILRALPIFEHFKTLKPTMAKHDNVSKKKIRNQKRHEHAGKIPSKMPFYQWNRRVREWSFASFVQILGGTPFQCSYPHKNWRWNDQLQIPA